METKISYTFAEYHRMIPDCQYSWLTPAGILSVRGPLTETEWTEECNLVAQYLDLAPEENYGRFHECYLVLDVRTPLAAMLADRLIMWALSYGGSKGPLLVRSALYGGAPGNCTMAESHIFYPALAANDWLNEERKSETASNEALINGYRKVLTQASQDWFTGKYEEFTKIAGEQNEDPDATPGPRSTKEEKQ